MNKRIIFLLSSSLIIIVTILFLFLFSPIEVNTNAILSISYDSCIAAIDNKNKELINENESYSLIVNQVNYYCYLNLIYSDSNFSYYYCNNNDLLNLDEGIYEVEVELGSMYLCNYLF